MNRMSMIEIEQAIEEGRDKVIIEGELFRVVKNYHAGHFVLQKDPDHLMDVYIERISGAVIDGQWVLMDDRCLRFITTAYGVDTLKPTDDVAHYRDGWCIGTCIIHRVTDRVVQTTIGDWYRKCDGYRMKYFSTLDNEAEPTSLDRDGGTEMLVPNVPENHEIEERSKVLWQINKWDKIARNHLPLCILQEISKLVEVGLARTRRE